MWDSGRRHLIVEIPVSGVSISNEEKRGVYREEVGPMREEYLLTVLRSDLRAEQEGKTCCGIFGGFGRRHVILPTFLSIFRVIQLGKQEARKDMLRES